MIPVLYPGNRLAPPSLLASMGAAPGFPVSRLADGDIGLKWTDTATGTRNIGVDLLSATHTIDTVILGAGHTLAGRVVALLSSAVGASGPYTERTTLTAGDPAQPHCHTFAPVTERWWLIEFRDTTVAPSLPELVLTQALPLPSSPVLRGQERGQRSLVIDLESYGGYEWNLVRGPVRWTALYPLLAMTAAQRDGLLAAHRALDGGARACYLTDGEGVTRWVTWADRHLRFSAPIPQRYDVVLAFREVLGAA